MTLTKDQANTATAVRTHPGPPSRQLKKGSLPAMVAPKVSDPLCSNSIADIFAEMGTPKGAQHGHSPSYKLGQAPTEAGGLQKLSSLRVRLLKGQVGRAYDSQHLPPRPGTAPVSRPGKF